MEREVNETSGEAHVKWVKRLFEVGQLLAIMSQETSTHDTTTKPNDRRAQDASQEGTHENRKSHFDDP